MVVDLGAAGDGPMEGGAAAPKSSQSSEIDELIFIKENVRLRSFQTQILECRTRPLLGESTHVMVMPLKADESQPSEAWPLFPGLHFLHTYTRLKMSSGKVSVMVRNMSDCPIFLKKGIQVAQVVLASLVPLAELSLEMEAIPGTETPQNVAAAKELVLAFHEIFALDGNELSCTSATEHEIHINDSEPFQEQFRHIPPLLLEEVHALLRDMLDVRVI